MKIVFFGTSEFGEKPLRGLMEAGHKILAVVTQPDRPGRRGRSLLPPPVKKVAQASGLPVRQPEDPNSAQFVEELAGLGVELVVVAAYAHKLGPGLLELPAYGCINIHPSLLPLYRGAAPVNWAIIRGEKQTGVTIMKMNERFDAGEILAQEVVEIGEDESAGELSDRLSALGRTLLLSTISAIERGEITPRSQDDEKATKAPRIRKADSEVDWSRSAAEIRDLIRGLYPRPGAYSHFRDKIIKFSKAEVLSQAATGEPGEIVGLDCGIEVSAGDRVISLLRVQPEGKREMSWKDFRNGFRPEVGERLGGRPTDSG
jgi:methionyl-tRNA formyltransferase